MLKNFAAILFISICGFTSLQAIDGQKPVVPVEEVVKQQKEIACRCKDKRFETEEESVQAQKKIIAGSELSCHGKKANEEEAQSFLACGKCRR